LRTAAQILKNIMTNPLSELLPDPEVWKLALKRVVFVSLLALFLSCLLTMLVRTQAKTSAASASLNSLAEDFWKWRAQYQPFSSDDIPRIEHPAGPRDWSATSIAKQSAALSDFEKRWKEMDTSGWSVPMQVDYRLVGSALARVRWELDINRRWQRDPSFYVEQTLTALAEALTQPPPFNAGRSRMIVARMEEIPGILDDARKHLRPVRPFAELAIAGLSEIRPKLLRVQRDVAPMLREGSDAGTGAAARFQTATEKANVALESFRAWLQANLNGMPNETAVGRRGYEFFLRNVAMLPCTPEQLLSMSRQEWDRTVAFEAYEKQRNRGIAELKLAASADEEIARVTRDELAIRKFLEDKGILSVPADIPDYTFKPLPDYLEALSDFTETDDLASLPRPNDDGTRWIRPPSPDLGFFLLATAKDPRPLIVHEGVPGHYFQLSVSRRNPDPIRRRYYDSGANEGIGFYAEEMMMQAGLFDDSPRSREIIYNFMRLRALRVEVDVKLALGQFTLNQAAEYLEQHVPMDKKTSREEAAMFATTPGQAISYQIGKIQILRLLADARLAQGDNFSLQKFHDFVWLNGNVPIALQRWEYLGKDDDLRAIDKRRPSAPAAN